MMKHELAHFTIGSSYGGNQDWFRTLMMRIGGCGAETACDSSIYFALHKGLTAAYPFDTDNLNRESYVDFAHMMEKYLWPRMTGIDRLEIYINGYGKYLRDRGIRSLSMEMFSGNEPYENAKQTIQRQIDDGYPIPTLVLRHRDKSLDDYVWHWFLINGYEIFSDDSSREPDRMRVKAVTYSDYEWLDLNTLWNTGYRRRGGLILYRITE